MDLRTSIEKAKRLREINSVANSGAKFSSPKPANGDNWVPPTYSQSSSVRIDLEILRKNRVLTASMDPAYIESYKVLRAQVLHRTREKGWRTIMVTSTSPTDGKTLTTINLGVTFAKEFNQTVMLVDADLRRQKMHHYLGIASNAGLVDHLIDNRPMSDLILWPGIENLTLISGGKRIQDSSEHLGSAKMKRLVLEMKDRYKDRYILFDTPPVLSGADAIAFAPNVDCVLIVVKSGKTGTRDLKKTLELIPQDKLLGFVLNDHHRSADGYYYY